MEVSGRVAALVLLCSLVLFGVVVLYVPRKMQMFAAYLPARLSQTPQQHASPRLIHLVWMANPLKAYTISAIDSVLRYIPHATLKVHIITPAGSNSTVLDAVKRRLEYQVAKFIEHPDIDLQIVLHPNVQDELIGTPLENYNIPQKYFGGNLDALVDDENGADRGGTPFGRWTNALVHSADVMRVLIVWKEGGLYLDVDHILLDNVWPLVEVAPAFIICENKMDGQEDGRCKTNNAFFAAKKGHPFLWDCMKRIALLIDEHHINGVWPLRTKRADEPNHIWFTAVGPDLFAKVKNAWLDEIKDVWVLSGPEVYPSALTLQEVRHRPFQQTPKKWPNTSEPLYVMPRRYFMPTGWQDLTLNTVLDFDKAITYVKAYGFHLWEMGKTSGNKIRPNFIKLIRDEPNTVLAYLFKKYCLIFCDVEELLRSTREIPMLSEFFTTAQP